jgi:surface protein
MSNLNPHVENRYQAALAMNRIGRDRNMGVLADPAFLRSTIGSYLPSRNFTRTNQDIREAVELWCRDPVAAEARYGHISRWNTSHVTDMSQLFGDYYGNGNSRWFNDDIGGWDVSRVTNMAGMFEGAESFNQDIGGWDVSRVKNMRNMFLGAESFNQDISGWDVDRVLDMTDTFMGSGIRVGFMPRFGKRYRRTLGGRRRSRRRGSRGRGLKSKRRARK